MYNTLTSNGNVVQNKTMWKLKIPLKIKIFLWYLKKGVVLTKDNVLRRNWKRNKKYSFCSQDETIKHLFFDCHVAKFMWRAIQFTFNFSMPSRFHDIWLWLLSLHKKSRRLIFVGLAAMCWMIWLSRNDLVFDKKNTYSYLQILFRGTHWCREWV